MCPNSSERLGSSLYHAVARMRFGASVFWLRRMALLDDEQTTLSLWHITREGSYRGIVKIIPE